MTALDWPITSSPVLDAVPEFYHYEDTGCEVSAACLDCPLPAMQQDDLTVEEAADRFSVTVRTIFRIMRRCRDSAMIDQEELAVFAAD